MLQFRLLTRYKLLTASFNFDGFGSLERLKRRSAACKVQILLGFHVLNVLERAGAASFLPGGGPALPA